MLQNVMSDTAAVCSVILILKGDLVGKQVYPGILKE